jgi:hypothetical protein
MMKKPKIALKPYLDTISGYCDTLSNEELTNIIIGIAKDVSTSDRVKFLEKIQTCLPDTMAVAASAIDSVEEIIKEGKSREREYYNEKYNRFSAFRREVKAVVLDSELLRNSGFFT